MGQAKQKTMTSRELADAIDDLIKLRVIEATDQNGNGFNARKLAEVKVREIADALKRLDHNAGIYVEARPLQFGPPRKQ
jgi:hypothetical protein